MDTNSSLHDSGVVILNVNDKVVILSNDNMIKSVRIYDMSGRLISFSDNVLNTTYTAKPISGGAYVGVIEMVDGKVFDVKIVL